jgi:uncharacterized membrane protein YccC
VLIVDVVVGLVILGLGLCGTAVAWEAHRQRRAANPRAQLEEAQRRGEANAARAEARAEAACSECSKATDPAADFFVAGKWWHRECYLQIMRSLK